MVQFYRNNFIIIPQILLQYQFRLQRFIMLHQKLIVFYFFNSFYVFV